MVRHSLDLCNALKMQNNPDNYKLIRREIIAISKKHFDLTQPCGAQKVAVKATKNELAERWPDFFGDHEEDSVKALKCAIIYINQTHASYRSKVRAMPRKTKKVVDPDTKILVEQIPTTQSQPPSTQIPLVERMTRNLEFYSNNTPASSQGESSGSSRPDGAHPSAAEKCNTTGGIEAPLPAIVKSQVLATSCSSNRTILSQSMQVPTDCSVVACMPSAFGPVNVQAIHEFLRTCLPPMDHFLYRFINAGLRTEEGLLGASRWQRELMESFLDKLPPHSDGSPVLLMEKMVLLHQFGSYFL